MSAAARRAGWTLTTLASLFLLWDGVIKVLVDVHVVEGFARLGIPAHLPRAVGLLELGLLALHLLPATEVAGAVLLTGFLGGATMLHLRVGDPVATHLLFPGYVGALLWAGLLLRRPHHRVVLPFHPHDP